MKIATTLKSIVTGIVLITVPLQAQDEHNHEHAQTPSQTQTLTELEPIPESERVGHWGDIIYGSLDAPVELIEYASLTCSHCGNFARDIFPLLKEKYIDTGKVRLRFRNFILNQTDFALAVVSRCKDEELAKKITHAFLSKQASWMGQQNPGVVLEALATIQGLPMNEFSSCLENKHLAAHLGNKRAEWASKENIQHTPTIKMDGVELSPPTWVKLDTAIEMKLSTLK